ncbi:MAG: PIN domain-containing protein [Actinobacteria bacterium]|nr:PIN domain-containing protein [Actinomycetota bacterium]MCG2798348.1 PIN domain-containing protein [Cellulomonas sp.]
MNDRVVLDTSVLIADTFEPADGQEYAISAASLAELHYGVLVADPEHLPERLRRLTAIERAFHALPVDAAVAASYGTLAAAVRAVGRQPRARQMDLLIAATAHAHGARLLTHNLADFAGVTELMDVREP